MRSQLRVTRRDWLRATSATAVCGLLASDVWSQENPSDRYAGLDSAKYLGDVQIEATVKGEKYFTEGPVVDAELNVYFSNLPPGESSQILKWYPKTKKLEVFRKNANGANGLAFDAQGRLIACEGSSNDTGRVTRTDLKTGSITVLCDAFGGKPLGAPNDLVLDAKGRIYFTSRLANADPNAGNVNSVYRIDPDSKAERVLSSPAIDMPNGVELSPDGKIMYLIESDGRERRTRGIRRYDVQPDGSVTNGKLFVNFFPGRSGDGLCMDAEGNLYVAAGLNKLRATTETLDTRPGIHVISPEGKLLAFARTPVDTITNCAFGGEDRRTLYITCGPHLLSCRTRIARATPLWSRS